MFCPAQSERYFCSVPLNTAVSFEIGEEAMPEGTQVTLYLNTDQIIGLTN